MSKRKDYELIEEENKNLRLLAEYEEVDEDGNRNRFQGRYEFWGEEWENAENNGGGRRINQAKVNGW